MDQKSRAVDTMASECLDMSIRLLSRAVSGIFDRHLLKLGIKGSQLNILIATAKMGIARPSRLCEVLCFDPSTISRNVERLRASGWVETVPDHEDARSQPIRLTDRGRQIIEESFPIWELAQTEAKRILGEAGVKLLGELSRNFRESGAGK